MNFSSLSAADRNILIAGALAAVVALISFVDPSGQWGGVMVLALLGGVGGAFLAIQSQVAPTMKLPVTRGLALLVAGAVATGGFAIAMLSYFGYITRNITDVYVLLMIVGLVASIFLLWTGWRAYKSEPKAATPPSAPPEPPAPPVA